MQAELESAKLTHARRIGRNTGMAVAVLTGLGLCLFAGGHLGIILSVLVGTGFVTLLAGRVGQIAAEWIAPRHFTAAIGIGALAGLAALLGAAIVASGVGLIWGLLEHTRGSGFFYSYVAKPFLAVVTYGAVVALLLGVIAGLIIRGLLGRAP